MISLSFVLLVHDNLIENYGGLKGVRDISLLDSAINRPFATFDGVDLYEDGIKKASAVFESILINHPFLDGNKRTAFALLVFVLRSHELILEADENEIYNYIISITEGKYEFDEIEQWIRLRVTGKNI